MPFSRNTRIALIAALSFAPLALTAHLAGVSAQTQNQCEGNNIFKILEDKKFDCKRERITGSGGMRPTMNLAMGSGEKEWKREVVSKFGERYQTLPNAVCRSTECVDAAIGGLKRCTVSAIPCAKKPVFEGSASISSALSNDEIKEIQKLLKVKADGNFGSGSVAALQKWQNANKMKDDGIPTKDVLEKLRKGSKS